MMLAKIRKGNYVYIAILYSYTTIRDLTSFDKFFMYCSKLSPNKNKNVRLK